MTTLEDDHRNLSNMNSLRLGGIVSPLHTSRPPSSYTIESSFVDSAVDMDATTPDEHPDHSEPKLNEHAPKPTLSPSPVVDQSLADKMRQLAAVAWTLEQDDSMSTSKRDKIRKVLADLETQLDAEEDKSVEDVLHDGQAEESAEQVHIQTEPQEEEEEEEDVWIDESDLITVRENLATTVAAMRLRHEEQKHLHQFTVSKLEAVAQRCISQQQQVRDLLNELQDLRTENRTIGAENDELREKVSELELEASRNEVAVHAMSSAVTGLEGWIDSTAPSRNQTPVPPKKNKRQKVVIRGKGRFRGRYYVDEDNEESGWYSQALSGVGSHQELHEGVKAWLRGFHDVEEELRQHEPQSHRQSRKSFEITRPHEEIDWGDFEEVESP